MPKAQTKKAWRGGCGSTVGTATMPPVAAIPVTQHNGSTARDATMRPLQTCRKYRTVTGCCNNKIHHPVGAGHCPARDITETRKSRVIRRHGYYAARRFCGCRPIPRRGGVTPPYIAKKKCARAAGTPKLLSFIFYLLSIYYFSLSPPKYSISRRPSPQRTKNFYVLAKKPGKNT